MRPSPFQRGCLGSPPLWRVRQRRTLASASFLRAPPQRAAVPRHGSALPRASLAPAGSQAARLRPGPRAARRGAPAAGPPSLWPAAAEAIGGGDARAAAGWRRRRWRRHFLAGGAGPGAPTYRWGAPGLTASHSGQRRGAWRPWRRRGRPTRRRRRRSGRSAWRRRRRRLRAAKSHAWPPGRLDLRQLRFLPVLPPCDRLHPVRGAQTQRRRRRRKGATSSDQISPCPCGTCRSRRLPPPAGETRTSTDGGKEGGPRALIQSPWSQPGGEGGGRPPTHRAPRG